MQLVGWIDGRVSADRAPAPSILPGVRLAPFEAGAAAHATGAAAILLAVDSAMAPARAVLAATMGDAPHCPILVLTPTEHADLEIAMLRSGADCCAPITAPPDLLAARLEAMWRRCTDPDRELVCADLRIDLLARTARRGGTAIELLPREYALLVHLARLRGAPANRRQLLSAVWHRHFDPGTNVVAVHMSRLRAKVDRGFARPLIRWSRGKGYRLSPDPD
ncbi:two-component system OmpR family response regulator [Sphingomonas zeicaulis]|uniref:winged helix-turn-helix domain-containing protein n=1 Tax=Sphingomonas zeicaulis TaxID=1632740 RepID=UPI003D1E6BBE